MSKLPSRSIVVSKVHEPTHLVRVIRSLLIATGKTPKMKENILDDLSDRIELKPGGFGFSVDLKKVFSALKKRMTRAQPDACSRRKNPRG